MSSEFFLGLSEQKTWNLCPEKIGVTGHILQSMSTHDYSTTTLPTLEIANLVTPQKTNMSPENWW